MPWLLVGLAAVGVYFIGKSRGWFGSPPIVCDVESDMPDAMKQQVLAQLAANKNPASLNALAVTLSGSNYIQSAYCLAHQAWVLGGSKGSPPAAPTQAQIQAAQAQRAVAQGVQTPAGAAIQAATTAAAATAGPLATADAATNAALDSLAQQTAPGAPWAGGTSNGASILQQLTNLAVANAQPQSSPGNAPTLPGADQQVSGYAPHRDNVAGTRENVSGR